MRLGKEQAAGYVEDTEVGEPVAEDISTGQSQLTAAAAGEPALPVA